MSINFHGIKNTGGTRYSDENSRYVTVCTELTNDENGNDLDEFKSIFKKFPTAKDNEINLIYSNTPEGEEYVLNNKILKINDENIKSGAFTKLVKLMSKIVKTENRIEQNDNKTKNQGSLVLEYYAKLQGAIDCSLRKNTSVTYTERLGHMYKDINVRRCAKAMGNCIQNSMEDYYA